MTIDNVDNRKWCQQHSDGLYKTIVLAFSIRLTQQGTGVRDISTGTEADRVIGRETEA